MASRKQKRIEPGFSGALGGLLDMSPADERRPSSARGKSGKAKASKRARKRSSRGSRSALGRLFGGLVYWCFVLGIWGGIAAAGLVAWYGMRMPSAATWEIPDRPPNVKILAVNGKLVANRGMTGGEALGLHDISPYVPQAVIAIEDRRFYSHFGVDPIGLARAMSRNLMAGSMVQGGSTLTQQLAKNLFLKPERTLERKVQEVLLAFWLEQKYSKDQIIEMYLNRVYFGSGSYGVEAASRRYFNKPARDVSLSEAALLAGLLKAPSRLSPARDPEAAKARSRLVLAAMRDQGMISDTEFASAEKNPPTRAAAYWTGSEHYVADRVMEELPGLIGDVRTDVIVDTTIDLDLQRFAEDSIRTLIAENGEAKRVSQGALVSIDSSGAIRAMVGGYDYANSQFDRATEARRQPGSTFKPFVYMAAVENGARPDSMRNDAPVRIGKWTPENYKGKYYGPVTLTEALSKSLNSVAAQLAQEVGPARVAETAKRMGIDSELTANASIALGTSEVTLLELTAAYVPFANGGYRPPAHIVRRVTTTDGDVLYENKAEGIVRVARPDTIAMMNAMMSQTIKVGTGKAASFGWPAAGKTGTSQNSRDAWFVGYTTNLTTGVWFGNDDGTPMKNVTGGTLPATAWRDFMDRAHKGVPVARLPGLGGDGLMAPDVVSSGGDNSIMTTLRDILEGKAPIPPAPVPGGAPQVELQPVPDMTPTGAVEQVPVPVARRDRSRETATTVSVPSRPMPVAGRPDRPVPPGDVGAQAAPRGNRTLFDLLTGG